MATERSELFTALPVSAVALAVDVALLHALVAVFGWHYLLAGSVGFTAGVAVNYLLSIRYVFRYRRVESAAREFVIFAIVGVAGLALNAAVLALFVDGFGQHYLFAKAVAAGASFLFNFGVRRQLLFRPTQKDSR